MNVKLYHGDCMDILPTLPEESVDAFILDPPYLKKHLHLYGEMAEEAKRILKHGGSFISIVPHYAMPQVLNDVSKHLKWRWCHSMWQASGRHPRMAMGIEVMWKPIGWWVKGSWPQGRGFVRDGFANDQPDKVHPWEQSEDWAEFCLKMVPENGVVLDAAMGRGTVGVACARLGYDFIGIELDKKWFKEAKLRIEGA